MDNQDPQNEAIHLEHALLGIRDRDVSVAFYSQLFPTWTVRWEGETNLGTRWFHFGPAVAGRPGYLSLRERAAGEARPTGIEHIGFAHPDVNALVERLADHGIKPSDRVEADGYRRAYFVDPDGNELEFVEELAA